MPKTQSASASGSRTRIQIDPGTLEDLIRDLPDPMTASELAVALRVTESTIGAWSRRGVLPAGIRLGGLVRFPKRSLRGHFSEAATAEGA